MKWFAVKIKNLVPYKIKVKYRKVKDFVRYKLSLRPSVGLALVGDDCSLSFSIPKHVERLMVDVGLSENAPNSADWLSQGGDIFVIGIEANKFNVDKLLKNGPWRRTSTSQIVRPKSLDNFQIVYCAIDDVTSPTYSKFYHVLGDPGTSSMYEPQEKFLKNHHYSVFEHSDVPTVALSTIFRKLGLTEGCVIDTLKVDTQGKDLAVLKSAGKYLESVRRLIVEIDTYGQYKGAPSRMEIVQFIENCQFVQSEVLEDVDGAACDVVFVNKRFLKTSPPRR